MGRGKGVPPIDVEECAHLKKADEKKARQVLTTLMLQTKRDATLDVRRWPRRRRCRRGVALLASFIVAAIDQFSCCLRAAATAVAAAALSLGRRRRRRRCRCRCRFSCLLVAFVRAHCLLPRYTAQGYQPADRMYRTHLTS